MNFLGLKNTFLSISLIVVIISILSSWIIGLNFGIDFRGGVLLELRSKSGVADVSQLRTQLNRFNLGEVSIQEFGKSTDALLRIQKQEGDEKSQDAKLNQVKEMLSINPSNNDSMNNNEQWGFEINKSESGIKLVATFIIEGDINIENLGFIASHEVMKENHTTVLGAVKIIQGLENPSKYNNTIPIFLIFLALGIFASLGFLERKNESDVEE